MLKDEFHNLFCFRVGHWLAHSFPDEVNRDSCGNDNQAGPGSRRLIDEQDSQDHSRAKNEERRDDRVTERAIRALGVGARFSQSKYPGYSEDVKYERSRDDIRK